MKIMNITKLLILAGSITSSAFTSDLSLKRNEAVTINANELKVVQKTNNDFAFNFFKEINKDHKDNTFFSPYSIVNSLVMATEGARGNTALEMGKALSFPDELKVKGEDAKNTPWEMMKLHKSLSELNKLIKNNPESEKIKKLKASLKKRKAEAEKLLSHEKHEVLKKIELEEQKIKGYQFSLVNDMWIDEGFEAEVDYVDKIHELHESRIRPAYFSTKPEEMRGKINKQVFDDTFGKISNLLPAGSISTRTVMVLSNAIYFKGDWLKAFDKENTYKGNFHTFNGKQKVDMMTAHRSDIAKYAAFDGNGNVIRQAKKQGFEMLEIPYQGKDLSMLVILPSSKDELQNLQKKLSSASLNKWMGSLRKQKVNIKLPKFKVESSIREDKMRKALGKLGMKDAFTRTANFGGIDKSQNIAISGVFHKAFIEVNEAGTEASAATAVVFVEKGASSNAIPRPSIPTFNADRPFIYIIKEYHSNTVLLMGRLINP